jgi:hypothetical protein
MKFHKTIFLVSAFQFCCSVLSAQSYTSKGTVEIGGDFSFSFQKSSDQKELSFSTYAFNAYAGRMVLPGFEIGVSPAVLGYNNGNYSTTQFSIYFRPAYNFELKSNVNPYVELLAGYGLSDDGNNVANVSGLGGDAGIKVRLRESGLLLIKVEYLRHFINFQNQPDQYNYIPDD